MAAAGRKENMKDILSKFKFRAKGAIINAPEIYRADILEIGFRDSMDPGTLQENTVVFLYSKSEFIDFLRQKLPLILPDSVLWFAYQKGSSKIKTGLNRDIIRETAEQYGITTVTAISIDETWSALRFRPVEKVGKKA